MSQPTQFIHFKDQEIMQLLSTVTSVKKDTYEDSENLGKTFLSTADGESFYLDEYSVQDIAEYTDYILRSGDAGVFTIDDGLV